jgi:hypothetical protein
MGKRRDRPGLIRPLLRIGVVVALGAAARDRLAEPDEQARKLIYGRRVGVLEETMPALTDLGSVYAIGGAAGALWLLGRRRLGRDTAIA